MKTKEVVVVECNGTPYRFENCKVVETHDRVIISDKTTGEVIGSFPINTTAWHTPQY